MYVIKLFDSDFLYQLLHECYLPSNPINLMVKMKWLIFGHVYKNLTCKQPVIINFRENVNLEKAIVKCMYQLHKKIFVVGHTIISHLQLIQEWICFVKFQIFIKQGKT